MEEKRRNDFNCMLQQKLKQKRFADHRDHLAKKLFQSLPDITVPENKCYQNAIKYYASKWDEQEKKRNEHHERLRKERLIHHAREMDEIKQAKENQQHEFQVEKMKRELNEKIDLSFYRQQYADRVQKAKQLRQVLSQQIDEDKKTREDEVITSRIETNRAIEWDAQNDDKHFFDYASKLLHSAKCKGIPVHPLKKVIDEYTVQNSLLPQSDDLPHMKSQIDIGISLERKYSTK